MHSIVWHLQPGVHLPLSLKKSENISNDHVFDKLTYG